MPNKNYCQGPNCHTRDTKDRYHGNSGSYRGRYAYCTRDSSNGTYTYFCTTGCVFDWLGENLGLIFKHRALPKFITERRTTPEDQVLDR